MSCASILSGILRRGIKPTFASSNGLLAQQTRNTFILKRQYPLRLHAKGQKPQKFRPKNWIYELVENTETTAQKPIDIILMTHVTGIGSEGEIVSMKPHRAYNQFLLPGLATYASPENMKKYQDMIEKSRNELPTYSSTWVPRTMNMLSCLALGVVVSKNTPWILEKYHIRAAFRKINIHVPDYAITMPNHEITGPDMNKQNKEFYITVTINKRERVKVRCRLHHFTSKEIDKIPPSEFWKKRAEAIFPEDQIVLDAMPQHRLCETDKPIVSV